MNNEQIKIRYSKLSNNCLCWVETIIDKAGILEVIDVLLVFIN